MDDFWRLHRPDVLANTIEKLTLAESGVPQEIRQKRVDDQPVASPATLDWGEEFVASYKRICSELNLELSDDCSD
jgi:hypothetical protein